MFLSLPIVLSHQSDINQNEKRIDNLITNYSVNFIIIGSIIISIFTIISIFYKTKKENLKKIFFICIITPTIIITLFITGGTIYLNLNSVTGGPVHWHADFEIWNCGEKIDIKNPTGFSNRIGTPVLHEHGDDRIHVEGLVVKNEHINLHSFFDVIGGSITNESFIVPTNQGILNINGNDCNGKTSEFQVFVYKIINPNDLKNWIYIQEKIENPSDYILSPYSTIPPGDCIIFEFDEVKNKTDKICETNRISITNNELREMV